MPIRRGRFAPQNTFLETIAQKFDHGNSNFVLGSAQEKNNYPIVYCSDGFCELTGFSRSDLMRRSCACNFLYGLESNQDDVQSIENALKTQNELKKEILFYKKNGSPFYCLLDIVPIKNEKGNVVLFLVSHKDVTTRKLSGEVNIDDDQANLNGGGKPTAKSKISRSRSRKFSRDVLLHLSRQYQQTSHPNKTTPRRSVKRSRSFSFTSERLPLYKRESTKKSKFLFLHYSNKKGLWDWWVLVLTFYIAIMVPYNVAFSRHGKARDLIIVDMVIELFFILDIVVHFRTTYVNNTGRIVYDQKAIAVHYLKGWFVLDFLAALPFEALYFINQSWGFLVQLLKCGRLLRLFRVVRKLHRYTEYSTVLLTLLMLAFAMVAHWLACVWYVIGLEEVSEKSTISWLYQFGEVIHRPYVNFSLDTGPDEGSAYVTALYFTLTSMTTVGFGNVSANTNAEKVFAVIVMLIGALMHAAIFGNVAAIIQKLYANRVRYHSRANEIKQFIRVHHIDVDLSNRLEDYFHTTWSLSGGVDTREILATFPVEIQSDVCMHLYKGILELPLFSQVPRGLIRMLSLQVRPVYVGPGDYLLMQNDVVNCIYFIANGSMEVLQGESVAAILGKGDLFGEDISRKIPIRRSNGDVRALTYCDIYYITRDLLQEVMHLYPDFAYKFSEKLELTYDLGASERDIWRRGGLDSISEDEEENEDETSDSPETTSDVNTVFQARNRFDLKTDRNPQRPNHFNANESWRLYSRPQIQRRNRIDVNESMQPLLSSPENLINSAVRIAQPSKKQISFDCKMKEQIENTLSDENLEWEQEPFSLKEDEDERNSTGSEDQLNEVSVEPNTSRNNGGTRMNDSEESSHHTGIETSYRLAKDAFLKHLRLSAEDHEHDHDHEDELDYFHQNSMSRTENDPERSFEHERDDLNGLTKFAMSTPPPGSQCHPVVRSLASPTHSLNYVHSPHTRSNRNSVNYNDSLGSLLGRRDSPRYSPRDERYMTSSECLGDGQTRDSPSSHHDIPRHAPCPSSATDSPYVSIRRLFTLTPPPREDITDYSSNGELNYRRRPESPVRFRESRRSSRNSLRQNLTPEVMSPSSSCGGLDEDRPSSSRRRRKVSTTKPPAPSVFANLLAHTAKSPYADFVPPKTVRESSITCNCEEEESCSACGDKDSLGQANLNGNLSSYGDDYESSVLQEDLENQRTIQERHEISEQGYHSPNLNIDYDENQHTGREEITSPVSASYLFGISASNLNQMQVLNGVNVNSTQNVLPDPSGKRKRPLMTRDAAVYSSASLLDEAEYYDYNVSPINSPRSLTKKESVDSTARSLIDHEVDFGCDISDAAPPLTNHCVHLSQDAQSSSQSASELEGKLETSEVSSFLIENDFKKPLLTNCSVGATERRSIDGTSKCSQSSLSSLSTQSLGIPTSDTDLDCIDSISNPGRHEQTHKPPNNYKDSNVQTFHTPRPAVSSTHSLDEVSGKHSAYVAAQAMKSSFSEPYLQIPDNFESNVPKDSENDDDLTDFQLEDIFKDVKSAKEAMERLQMILKHPEPANMSSDLADTKETVKRLDQQVLILNRDVTSLRGDVKMVLELLKDLKK